MAVGDSVMPPWVRMQFREASRIVRPLRDSNCGNPQCGGCADRNDPQKALQRWFGFPAFRPEPADEQGRPLQERIVAEAMAGNSVLGILPTGTGKSVCYQIPALSRFDKTGALTVVISPLVALMADQVQGLQRAGISSAVTVNGMLSLPERHDAVEKLRMGDAAILLISPEQLLLAHLNDKAPSRQGKDVQVETTQGNLLAALNGDALLRDGVRDMSRLTDRALLWLHEQQVVTLGRGLTMFRPAMTDQMNPSGGRFTEANFAPLEDHYIEQTIQTHMMAAYAERGLASMERAQKLSTDYFEMEQDAFLRLWLSGRGAELRRQTTGPSWKMIVEALDNPAQQEIVRDDREQTNGLVLADPGSGKTRVLVHRIAYLLRVRREDPRGILVLSYNRHAAAEIRESLGG